jgi:hypothetical protein
MLKNIKLIESNLTEHKINPHIFLTIPLHLKIGGGGAAKK